MLLGWVVKITVVPHFEQQKAVEYFVDDIEKLVINVNILL